MQINKYKFYKKYHKKISSHKKTKFKKNQMFKIKWKILNIQIMTNMEFCKFLTPVVRDSFSQIIHHKKNFTDKRE